MWTDNEVKMKKEKRWGFMSLSVKSEKHSNTSA